MLLRTLSLGLAVLTTGLIAGFFYAYACSVTLGTARLDDVEYVATMQAINASVLNPIFALSFFGAPIALVVASAVHLRQGLTPRAGLVLLALLLYGLGGFALTIGVNVPLNEELARLGPGVDGRALAEARQGYEIRWNAWNVVRTICSIAAFVSLIAASSVRQRAV